MILRSSNLISEDPWRLPDDYPVVVDPDGDTVARYADFSWSLWGEGRRASINFGDGPLRANTGMIDSRNAFVLRRIAAWWLHGPRPFENAATVQAYFVVLRPIFVLCTKRGVLATDLVHHPVVAEEISTVVAPSKANDALMLLHSIHAHRSELGFTLLDDLGLRRLSSALPDHQARQTAYIPSRIWMYQVLRLKEFLDDYRKYEESIRQCFSFCLDAYGVQRNRRDEALGGRNRRPPFCKPSPGSRNARYLGPFSQTAEQFGLLDLFQKWTAENSKHGSHTISNFSNYLTAATRVSAAYITNMSLMRIGEVWDLAEDCLIVEKDEEFGSIYTLSGRTTKTIQDDDARWIASPSVVSAIDVATSVCNLRASCFSSHPDAVASDTEERSRRLFWMPYEPWSQRHRQNLHIRRSRNYPSYQSVVSDHPKLFASDQLQIRAEDLEIAQLLNPDLDRNVYVLGEVWPFAWHQLRRTGAVNMQASGLVSDPAMQYQLKHARRAMSLYYGRGFGKLSLQRDAAATYVRTMYEVIGKKLSTLTQEAFVSPYGPDRKEQVIELVRNKDHKFLVEAARNGQVAWRDTLLGGCTKRGPCSYGGIDNVIRCGGGDGRQPCADAIFDKRKVPQILRLRDIINERICSAEKESPLYHSLQCQLLSIERTLNVLL
jgi:hypothetical protein